MVSLLLACVVTPDDSAAPLPDPEPSGDVPLTDANSYTYTGILDAPSYPLAALSDATAGWSGLTDDIQCHPLDPVADIDDTALLVFPYLTEEEVEDGLSNDSLEQSDLTVYLSFLPGDDTEVSLSELTFFGTDADIETLFEEGSGTWMLLLKTGTTVAAGARMLAFLEPRNDTTETRAEVTDGCSVLDFSADLESLTPVPVLSQGPWLLDWSGLTRDGHGNPFVAGRVDGVMIARFDETVPELQANFLDLTLLAEQTWNYTVASGTAVDLGAMTGPSEPFPGFTGGGVWALALTCSLCPNPAPIFLTVLVPS
jgi:hypothetical protein